MRDQTSAVQCLRRGIAPIVGIVCSLAAQPSTTSASDPPVLVRMAVRGERSITNEAGVLLADESGELRILDLRTGQERTFKTAAIRSLTSPATEQDVAAVTGIAPLVSWFIANSLPSRPKTGKVASVDGAVAYINIGAGTGVKAGERFDVFRGAGHDIVDPETGEVLGKTQKRIAQVEVLEAHDKLSKIRVAGEFEVELAVGDPVRPVAAEQAVAVLPLGRDSGQLIQGGVQLAEQITSGLSKNGVTVVERTVLNKVLEEQALAGTGQFDPDAIQRVGQLLQAQAVVTGTIQVNGKEANVNVRLIAVETGKVLYAASLKSRDLNTTPARSTTRTIRSAPAAGDTDSVPDTPGPAAASVLTPLRTLEGHIPQDVPPGDNGGVIGLAFSPDSALLVSGGDDQTVRLWSVEDGQLLRTMEGHASDVRAVAFSPDNQTIASGGIDKLIRLWSTDGRLLRALKGHGSWVLSVAFSPDGQTLASGSDDHTIRLWSVATGRLVRELPGHSFRVRDVAFNPDGRVIASASCHPEGERSRQSNSVDCRPATDNS